jgi:hypothetical protein
MKTRAEAVTEAARDALAILEGNSPHGDFVDPAGVAGDVLRDALIAHDSQSFDGGYALDETIAGLTLYAADGRIAATVKVGRYPTDRTQRDAFAAQLAELLGLVTFNQTKGN